MVLFVRPTAVAGDSAARKVLVEVEDAIVVAIQEAMQRVDASE